MSQIVNEGSIYWVKQIHLKKSITTLSLRQPVLADDQVDLAWGEAFFGLDISIGKIQQPLFREAIAATKRINIGFVRFSLIHEILNYFFILSLKYKGPHDHKMFGSILETIYAKYVREQEAFSCNKNCLWPYYNCISGDGATILGSYRSCHQKNNMVETNRLRRRDGSPRWSYQSIHRQLSDQRKFVSDDKRLPSQCASDWKSTTCLGNYVCTYNCTIVVDNN